MIAEIVSLRDRVSELEAENHWLRQQLEPAPDRFLCLGLTAQERRVLGRIYDASPRGVKTDSLIELVGQRKGCEGVANPAKLIAVVIHKIRKKLSPLGVEIVNIWGEGFSINEGGKLRIAQKIGEAE